MGIINKIKKCMMHFTYAECNKRIYSQYKIERRKLEALSKDELECRYIDIKSTYEYKKNIFTFLMVTILIVGVTNIWEIFYKFCIKVFHLQMATTQQQEAVMVVVYITIILVVFVTVVIFAFMILYLRSVYRLHKQLLMVEKVLRNKE